MIQSNTCRYCNLVYDAFHTCHVIIGDIGYIINICDSQFTIKKVKDKQKLYIKPSFSQTRYCVEICSIEKKQYFTESMFVIHRQRVDCSEFILNDGLIEIKKQSIAANINYIDVINTSATLQELFDNVKLLILFS
jgi:hypothetical protein